MNTNMKVAFYTLGCKLNFSETSTISRSFKEEGFDRVDFSEKADIYVINTCSVTENADKKFKSIARQAHKTNPEALIIAVGCYAQLKPQELAAVDGVEEELGDAVLVVEPAALVETMLLLLLAAFVVAAMLVDVAEPFVVVVDAAVEVVVEAVIVVAAAVAVVVVVKLVAVAAVAEVVVVAVVAVVVVVVVCLSGKKIG